MENVGVEGMLVEDEEEGREALHPEKHFVGVCSPTHNGVSSRVHPNFSHFYHPRPQKWSGKTVLYITCSSS